VGRRSPSNGPYATTRIDHYDDPTAPKPNHLVPAASAVVQDSEGRILMAQRSDSGQWTTPGGAMEPGETIARCAIREVEEETGLIVEVVRLAGIYSDPRHVVEYADGEVRQQFSVCFACRPTGGAPRPSDESTEVRWVALADLAALNIHPSIRLRIDHFLAQLGGPWIG
jgi:8-oxo-dGTP pyrophosphatase MutT (NUDIX family)